MNKENKVEIVELSQTKLRIFPQTYGYLNTKFTLVGVSNISDLNICRVSDEDGSDLGSTEIDCDDLYETHEAATNKKIITFKEAGIYRIKSINDASDCTTIKVKDAIKLGGSLHKRSYVYDDNPWCLIVMKDRTYFHNRTTGEEFMEYISPDNVECVSNDIFLFQTADQKSLFSMTHMAPIVHFNTYEYLDKDMVVFVSEHNSTQRKVEIIRFDTLHEEPLQYVCENAKVDDINRILYYHIGEQYSTVNLSNLETKEFKFQHKFVAFVPPYAITEKQYGYYELTLCRMGSAAPKNDWKTFVRRPLNTHRVHKIDGKEIFSVDLKKIEDFLKETNNKANDLSIDKISDVKIHMPELSFYTIKDNLYCLSHVTEMYIDKYDKLRRNRKYTLYLYGADLELSFLRMPSISVVNDLLIVKDGARVVIIDGNKVIWDDKMELILSNQDIFFLSKNDDWDKLYAYSNVSGTYKSILLRTGKLDLSLFKEYRVFLDKTTKRRFFINDLLKTNFISQDTGYSQYLEGGKVLYVNGTSINKNTFLLRENLPDSPGNIYTRSDTMKFFISARGTNVFLYELFENEYVEKEILSNVYDSSSYGKVFMTDDGEHILHQKDKEYILENVKTGEVESFENLNYIEHVNGYRPIVRRDAYRSPRLVDPMTLNEIDTNMLKQHVFSSPDKTLYADTKLKEYEYYLNILDDTRHTHDEYRELSCMYDYYEAPHYLKTDDCKVSEVLVNRKKLLEKHRDVFLETLPRYYKNGVVDEEMLTKLSGRVNGHNEFSDLFMERRGVAKILNTQTDKVVAKIELGSPLLYLNYVSFSHNSRYVAIAGKYPTGSGLFLIYDLSSKSEVAKILNKKAVWTTAFSKTGNVAAYTSIPDTYLYDLNVESKYVQEKKFNVSEIDENIRMINGANFLTYSSDGQYVATSNQGYIPYNSVVKFHNKKWGHQPSCEVHIQSVKHSSHVLATYNDLADGIEGNCTAKTAVSVSFSNNNKKLMMVGKDGTVVIRNLHLPFLIL